MKSHPFFALLGLMLALALPAMAQTTTATAVKKIPFHGKLTSVDTAANTITLQGKTSTRVFHLTPETKITDGAGNPATIAAAVPGVDVGGSYSKDAAGTMTLYSVRFGAKEGTGKTAAANAPPAPAAPAAPAPVAAAAPAAVAAAAPAAAPVTAAAAKADAKVKKLTFTGKVVSVDAAANTLVVHGKADQTFTVTPATKITDAKGTASTLAAITAGSKVSGTYSKSADGATLTVYTLKPGK